MIKTQKWPQWTLGGDFIDNFYYPSGCTTCSLVYTNDPTYLTNESSQAWWIWGDYDNPPTNMTDFSEDLMLPNGQRANMAALGKIKMFRPKVTMNFIQEPRYFTISDNLGLACKLKLGTNDVSDDAGTMFYKVEVDSTPITPSPDGSGDATNPHFYGNANITQLVTADYSNPVYVFSTERCDGPEFYNGTSSRVVGSAIVGLGDGPFNFSVDPNTVSISARDFVRFKPDGDGSIYVTLGIVTWDAIGTAEIDSWGDWILTTDVSPDPSGPDSSDEFPKWTQTIGGSH